LATTNKSTSIAGLFDSHGGASVQYRAHRLMKEVQGFHKSHLTLSSGDYSLHIAPVAARATANKMTMQNVSTLLTISMAIAMRRYYTARIA
jgi:hypothetical protein